MSESDEKRMLDEILKEVDNYFSKNGLLEDINACLKSNEVLDVIREEYNKLIYNMKKIEERAPESVQSVGKEIRTALENNEDSFRQDAIANFKIMFHFSVKVLLEELVLQDTELKRVLLEMIKRDLHEECINNIKEICAEMTQKNTKAFMQRIYMQHIIYSS